MTDTLFIQFYSRTGKGTFNLYNGYSDAWDLCERHGDGVWVEDGGDYESLPDEHVCREVDLPIRRGTAYVSALSLGHLYQAYVWAKLNPDVQFIVGGPVAAERHSPGEQWAPLYLEVSDEEALPVNFSPTGASVEEWFDTPNFSGTWKLELPEAVAPDDKIHFSYTLDNGCFWKQCIYCNIALNDPERHRARSEFRFEFEELSHPGDKVVRLNTGSLTPRHIRELLPKLPAHRELDYRAFMRTARAENLALQHAVQVAKGGLARLTLGLGIEFPSDRMLAYAGKGFGVADVSDTLRICAEHGIRANSNFILGWNNLTEGDVAQLGVFLRDMPHGGFANAQVRWLFAHPHTRIFDQYDGEDVSLGPFRLGKKVAVNGDQMRLNREAGDLIQKYAPIKGYSVDSDLPWEGD